MFKIKDFELVALGSKLLNPHVDQICTNKVFGLIYNYVRDKYFEHWKSTPILLKNHFN